MGFSTTGSFLSWAALNAGTIFAKRPIGNTPEGMPWDCVLSNCLINVVMYHVTVTSHLVDSDPRKFKLKTPADITSVYKRVLAAAIPSSSQIKTDVLKVLWSVWMIIKAHGALVPGLGNWMGGRAKMGSCLESIGVTGVVSGPRGQAHH
jgi:hypothetical protein